MFLGSSRAPSSVILQLPCQSMVRRREETPLAWIGTYANAQSSVLGSVFSLPFKLCSGIAPGALAVKKK